MKAFVAIPNPQNNRVLFDGTVTALEPSRVSVAFGPMVVLVAGQDVTLFAEVRGKFFQQAGQVGAVTRAADGGQAGATFG